MGFVERPRIDMDIEPLAHCLTCGREMPVSHIVNTYALVDATGKDIGILLGCWFCAAVGRVPVAIERRGG